MSLIVKGVFDITCSIFNAVLHVILRDLTNYYWYEDETEHQNDTAVEGVNSNNEGYNFLGSINENEIPEFVTGSECEGENIPHESFCTSLNIEDYEPDDLDEIQRHEDNTMVQYNKDKLNSLKLPEKESSKNIPDGLNENLNIEESSTAWNDDDHFNSFTTEKKESSNYIPDNFDETQWVEDDTVNWNNEDDVYLYKQPSKENCIWVEITENVQQKFEDKNQDNSNASEKDLSENRLEQLEECERTVNPQTENEDLEMDMEEESILLKDNRNLYNERNSKITSGDSTEKEYTSINDNETEKTSKSDEGDENDFFRESMDKEHSLENNFESSEKTLIGDTIKSETESQNDDKSNISSECELGIRNFQIHNYFLDEFPILEEPEVFNKKKETLKNKSHKMKISRHVSYTPLSKIKKTEQLQILEKIPAIEPTCTSEETQKVCLLPLTTYEITGTQSLLNEPQELSESENNVAPHKLTEFEDDLSEISKIPEEISDIASACSDDSWDSWLSRFASIVRSKSPQKNLDVPSIQPSGSNKEDENKDDSCDCVNSHRCLLVVDSDDELTADLLSPEQLGSVETGSVSDWLYRVNPRNPLLPSTSTTKLNETETHTTTVQEQSTNPHSESSDEDLAKQFLIERWLDSTKRYYTDQSSKFIGSGDIMC